MEAPASAGASDYLGVPRISNERGFRADLAQAPLLGPTSGGRGSSGGTIFYGGFVYGMQSNASDCDAVGTSPCTPARYYRIGSMKAVMQAASSDVKFICYNAQFCSPS